MMLNAKIVEPQDVRTRLELLAEGLTLDVLMQSLRAGVIAYDGTSSLAPPTTAGFNFWSAAVERLREALIPSGWTLCNDKNFSVAVSPCGKIRIACGHGTLGTGRPDLTDEPTTRSKKGPKTIAAIYANSRLGQYHMPFVAEPQVSETWLLIYHRDGEVINSELSLPGSYCHIDRRPDGWIERIPLPPISVDPAQFDDTYDGPDFDVPVIRRK